MKALIITDGSESIKNIAEIISGSLSGFKVKICAACEFDGTDLLAADVFFIGCENASPSSFKYLEDMLSHVNLALRNCGIFTVKEKSIKYLTKILSSCEAKMGEPLFAGDAEKLKKAAVNKWLKNIL